ncbi:MAG: mercuric transporter MerT family protein [Alphaproteobacteria bacterium]
MAERLARFPTKDQPARGTGAVLFTLGGLAAAVGAVSCCALPLLLTAAGLGTAWLGGISSLAAPHRGFLIAAAVACLAGGAALLWRQRTAAVCASGAICTRPAVRGLVTAGLLLGLTLPSLGYAYG